MIISNLKALISKYEHHELHRKLSMNELSNLTGISRTSLRPLYKGTAKAVKFQTLERLVDFFGVPVSKLFKVIPTLSIYLMNGFPNLPKAILNSKKSPNNKKYREWSDKFKAKIDKIPSDKIPPKMKRSTLMVLKSGKRTAYFRIYPKLMDKLKPSEQNHKHLYVVERDLGLSIKNLNRTEYEFLLSFKYFLTNATSKRVLFNQLIQAMSSNNKILGYIIARTLSHGHTVNESMIKSFQNKSATFDVFPNVDGFNKSSTRIEHLLMSLNMSNHLNYFTNPKNMNVKGVHLFDKTTNNFAKK